MKKLFTVLFTLSLLFLSACASPGFANAMRGFSEGYNRGYQYMQNHQNQDRQYTCVSSYGNSYECTPK